MKPFKVAAICGSLKRKSTSMGLIKACQHLNPMLSLDIIDIRDFPLFNEDLQSKEKPACVKQAFKRVSQCDALIFSHPNSNNLLSAPLKNAYDWLSRGGEKASVFRKPAAQMVTSFDPVHAYAAQHLKQVVQYCKIRLMLQPSVQVITNQTQYFDQNGDLVSEQIKSQLKLFLEQFLSHIEQCKRDQF